MRGVWGGFELGVEFWRGVARWARLGAAGKREKDPGDVVGSPFELSVKGG